MSAVKILNEAVLKGTDDEKTKLFLLRHKIVALNILLKENTFNAEPSEEASQIQGMQVKGMQIALPQTKFEKMIEIATKIPRVLFTILIDVLLLPCALVLLLVACCKPNFNPKQADIKQGKIPILLLHGSGFNDIEWVIGRQFLNKERYGSVFSFNYAGLVSNDPTTGIDDYANQITGRSDENYLTNTLPSNPLKYLGS